jgi:dihydroorotate dehydrogenase (NAD+) catalytic subunit
VHACAAAVDLPIVGMGGVATGRDALELAAAGATAVALGTILFSDPAAPGKVRRELETELALRAPASAPGIRAGVRKRGLPVVSSAD